LAKTTLKRLLLGEFNWQRFVRSTVLIIVLTYVGVGLYAFFFTDRIIFQPPRSEYHDTRATLKLKSPDGVEISATYLQNSRAAYTILYSHGNAEDLATLAPALEDLRAIGFSVFAYDYHGYGTSAGKPREKNAYEDEDAAYDYLVHTLHTPAERIIALGRSLGGAMAIDLAARKPLAGLIVESSFLSALRVVTHFRIFPFDKFRNLDKIQKVRCPVLVIHGRRDEVIPFWHGVRLFELANQPKMNLWVEGAGHNDLSAVAGPRYEQALQGFRDSLDSRPTTTLPADK
jgi:fermentation-respiration switch protein FrsA (DUF1100 family)